LKPPGAEPLMVQMGVAPEQTLPHVPQLLVVLFGVGVHPPASAVALQLMSPTGKKQPEPAQLTVMPVRVVSV
jgi:hypothetical protein